MNVYSKQIRRCLIVTGLCAEREGAPGAICTTVRQHQKEGGTKRGFWVLRHEVRILGTKSLSAPVINCHPKVSRLFPHKLETYIKVTYQSEDNEQGRASL